VIYENFFVYFHCILAVSECLNLGPNERREKVSAHPMFMRVWLRLSE